MMAKDLKYVVVKAIVFLAVLIYVVFPIDLAPGPIDDAIVILLGIASSKKLSGKKA